MLNMSNKKTKKVVSAVIIALLVLGMIIPTLTYFLY